MQESRPLSEITKQLIEFVEAYKGGQSALARAAGVSQPMISRLLSNPTRERFSSGLKKLCKYAGVATTHAKQDAAPDPSENTELMSALREVWDGTPTHAKAIARLIRDLKALK